MRIFLISVIFVISTTASYSNLIYKKHEKHVKAYYTQNDNKGWDSIVVGRVLSFSANLNLKHKGLMSHAQAKSKVTIRLYSKEGLQQGGILYIIDNRNIIVAKLIIRLIFKSNSFGYMLVGYGNFRQASESDRVIQKVEYQNSKLAYIYKSRGDYFRNIGEYGKAIKQYKIALLYDKNSPDVHFELGKIYHKQKIPHYAFREFKEAYKYFYRLYSNEDKFNLLKHLALSRYYDVIYRNIHLSLKERYHKESLNYCRKALRLYKESSKIQFILGDLYFRGVKKLRNDVKAKNYFLHVIQKNPDNVQALVALSVLYFKHSNKRKAKLYAKAALKIEPGNARARKILQYIK